MYLDKQVACCATLCARDRPRGTAVSFWDRKSINFTAEAAQGLGVQMRLMRHTTPEGRCYVRNR